MVLIKNVIVQMQWNDWKLQSFNQKYKYNVI